MWKTDDFMSFSRSLAWIETLTTLFRIRTWVTDFISHDNNHYAEWISFARINTLDRNDVTNLVCIYKRKICRRIEFLSISLLIGRGLMPGMFFKIQMIFFREGFNSNIHIAIIISLLRLGFFVFNRIQTLVGYLMLKPYL